MRSQKSMSDSAIRNRKRREALKQVGLCVVCGREKSHGRSICGTCQEKRRTPANRERKAELNREYRRRRLDRGLCRHCSNEAIPGISFCAYHRKKKAEWNQQYIESKSGNGIIRPLLNTDGKKQAWWKSLDIYYSRERLETLNAKR